MSPSKRPVILVRLKAILISAVLPSLLIRFLPPSSRAPVSVALVAITAFFALRNLLKHEKGTS